jgi:lipopolysaccharide transport system permease protein
MTWPRRVAQPAGLVWTLARTDFKARYQPTIGGFVWALLKPIAMFLVLMAVFSFVFGADPAYRFYLIVGLFLWDFFAEASKSGLASLHVKGYLLTKSRLPAWILVVASASNALITLAVFSVVIVLFLAVNGRPPTAVAIVLFACYQGSYALMVVGFSLASSVLFLRYRDLNQVWDLTLQAGFFLAPIVYPLSIIPERYHHWLYLWPPTPIIQFSRAVLVDGTTPTLTAHLLLAAETALVLIVGIAVFRSASGRVAEYV